MPRLTTIGRSNRVDLPAHRMLNFTPPNFVRLSQRIRQTYLGANRARADLQHITHEADASFAILADEAASRTRAVLSETQVLELLLVKSDLSNCPDKVKPSSPRTAPSHSSARETQHSPNHERKRIS